MRNSSVSCQRTLRLRTVVLALISRWRMLSFLQMGKIRFSKMHFTLGPLEPPKCNRMSILRKGTSHATHLQLYPIESFMSCCEWAHKICMTNTMEMGEGLMQRSLMRQLQVLTKWRSYFGGRGIQVRFLPFMLRVYSFSVLQIFLCFSFWLMFIP